MKKLLVLALAVCLILGMTATGYAAAVTGDAKFDKAWLVMKLGSGVVWVKVYATTKATGVPATQIRNGWAYFNNVQKVKIDSTCDYGVAVDVPFSTTYSYDSKGGPGTGAPTHDQFKCRLYAKASTKILDESGMDFASYGWKHLDGGDVEPPGGGPQYDTIWSGHSTANYNGNSDRVGVDFKVDLVGQTFPSGVYKVKVIYMVYEM